MQTSGIAHVQTHPIFLCSVIYQYHLVLYLFPGANFRYSVVHRSPRRVLSYDRVRDHRKGSRERRARPTPLRLPRRPEHKDCRCSTYLQRSPTLLHHFISQDFAPLVCGKRLHLFPRLWGLPTVLVRIRLYRETRNYFVVCLKNGADAGIYFYFISRLTQRQQRLLHRVQPETRIAGANGPVAYWCRGKKLNIYI